MEIQSRCPDCNQTDVDIRSLANIFLLFAGGVLILVSAALILLGLHILDTHSHMLKSSAVVYLLAFLAGLGGFGLILRYRSIRRRGLLLCRCRACGFHWKQSPPPEGSAGVPDRAAVLDMIRQCARGGVNRGLRLETAETLGRLGDTASIPDLIHMLQEHFPDPSVAKPRVAQALGKMGPAAVPALLAGLSDKELSVETRSFFAQALVGIGDERMVPPLLELLQAARQDRLMVRRRLLDALGRSGDRRAVPVLIQSLGEFPAGRGYLKSLTGRDFGRDRRKWQAWWNTRGKAAGEE